MATFQTVVRSTNKDYNIVYIRIIHKGKPDYIKTTYLATKRQLRGKDVKDNQILVQTNAKIKEYIDKLNLVDTENWTVKQVKEYILQDGTDISFTDFFNDYLVEMSKDGRDNPAKSYKAAINSLTKFMHGTTTGNINFSDLKIDVIKKWISSLSHTARAKNLYPFLIKAVFAAGLEKYNDYDNGILLIRNNPFRKGLIPDADVAVKRAIDKRKLKRVFTVNLSELKAEKRPQLAQDVAKLIFHLAGINTVDLYNLEKNNYRSGKLIYNRHKTTSRRKDKARFEISVPDEIKPLFEKYKGKVKLFDFSERYSDFNSFNKNLNKGFRKIADVTGINATTYTFRHSWATIAQNKCGASDAEVGFALNHSSAHRETVLYIKKDFSAVDVLNRKVIDYVNSPIIRKVKKHKKRN